jgi:hypothetical protein
MLQVKQLALEADGHEASIFVDKVGWFLYSLRFHEHRHAVYVEERHWCTLAIINKQKVAHTYTYLYSLFFYPQILGDILNSHLSVIESQFNQWVL